MRADVDGHEEGVVKQSGEGGSGLAEEGDAVDADALLGQVGRQQAHLAPRPPRRLCHMIDELYFKSLLITQQNVISLPRASFVEVLDLNNDTGAFKSKYLTDL